MLNKSHMERPGYTLQCLDTTIPLEAYLRDCVDVPRFLEQCQRCPNYDTRWSCPSFSFDPMEIWRKYDTLRIVGSVLVFHPDCGTKEGLDALKEEKNALMTELLAMEQSRPGSLALSAGTCELCPEGCSKPSGTPCRKPEQMRYSIEALGGNVSLTAERYLDTPLLWMNGHELPKYLALIGGLLIRHSDGEEVSAHG